ncbi:response regulator [Candidatus Margulisiibacteriota bacterium]
MTESSESKVKVLIADDEPDLPMMAKIMMEGTCYEIITATNGIEAIEMAKSEKPDIIVTDVVMPGKDGFEVCQTVRNTPEIAETPIIILSALGDQYHKNIGFEGGADDFMIKPFGIEELESRMNTLLIRSKGKVVEKSVDNTCTVAGLKQSFIVDQISSGSAELDKVLNGGLPKGGNVLLTGPMGSGKSTFIRKYVSGGLNNKEKCLWISLDDNPDLIKKALLNEYDVNVPIVEKKGDIRFVDAYSWSTGTCALDNEYIYAVHGILELNQLAGIIADASEDLGQTVQKKVGGRRVIDSISSILVDFELPSVQRFISQTARTAIAFGGVTTFYVLEEGTVSEQVLNNVKYLMDGVIEMKEEDNISRARVSHMKWIKYSKDWVVW